MSTCCIQGRFKTETLVWSHLRSPTIFVSASRQFPRGSDLWSGDKKSSECPNTSHPAQDKDAIEKHVKHKHGGAHSKETHASCWKVHHLNIWGVGSLSVLLSQQENKRAAAASSQPATYSHIAVTSKELNINALLCIDWKYTCHHNGLLDISE